jgi:hypothetical protein
MIECDDVFASLDHPRLSSNPAFNSRSCPGVGMVATGTLPVARISSGTSVANRSSRDVISPSSTVV